MDLVAEMLLENLQRHHTATVRAVRVRPRFIRTFGRAASPSGFAMNADRLLNRMFDYPRYLRRARADFDIFHVIDHSYSHLLRELPPGRAAVTCHDLHTFRCLLEPNLEPRSRAFQMMVRRILNGLGRAGFVACTSEATRTELLGHGLVRPGRTVVIPNGVAPIFSSAPDPVAENEVVRSLGPRGQGIELLNVGSIVPRKGIDVLLRVFAAVRDRCPGVRLIRVGGNLTAKQAELAQALRVQDSIVELPFLSVRTLAAVYRRAVLLLCPSEAEGFGLPVLEAMACGTPVVASELAALREVGGDAVTYAPAGDARYWTATVIELLHEMHEHRAQWALRRQAGVERAQKFSWQAYADRAAELYRDLLA
jgi:glycosyltransferase involved in cell wall biosynthesis